MYGGLGGSVEQRAEGAEMKNTRQFLGCSMPLKPKELREVLSAPKKQLFVFHFQASKLISEMFALVWNSEGVPQVFKSDFGLLEETFEMESGLHTVVTIKKIVAPKTCNKFTLLIINKGTFTVVVNYMHIVVQQICGTFSFLHD